MEISDSDTENGGGKDTDYISELTDLALNNECFNGTDTHFEWSVSAWKYHVDCCRTCSSDFRGTTQRRCKTHMVRMMKNFFREFFQQDRSLNRMGTIIAY